MSINNRFMQSSNLNPVRHNEQGADPIRIQPLYNFDSEQAPKVPCHYHQDHIIKYFDKNREYLLPLCDLCIPQHKQEAQSFGQTPNIVPYEQCLNEIYSNLAAQSNRICDLYHHIHYLQDLAIKNKLEQKQSLRTNPIQLINSAKEQVLSIVNNYFNTLTTFIQTKIPDLQKDLDAQPALQDLKYVWNQVIQDLEELNTPEETIEKVLDYYDGKLQPRNEKVIIDGEKIASLMEQNKPDYRCFGLDIPQLNVDPVFLPKFLWVLERYAWFTPPIPEPLIDETPRYVEEIRYVEPIRYYEPVRYHEPLYYDHYEPHYPHIEPHYQHIEPQPEPVHHEEKKKETTEPKKRRHHSPKVYIKEVKVPHKKKAQKRPPEQVQQIVHYVGNSQPVATISTTRIPYANNPQVPQVPTINNLPHPNYPGQNPNPISNIPISNSIVPPTQQTSQSPLQPRTNQLTVPQSNVPNPKQRLTSQTYLQ